MAKIILRAGKIAAITVLPIIAIGIGIGSFVGVKLRNRLPDVDESAGKSFLVGTIGGGASVAGVFYAVDALGFRFATHRFVRNVRYYLRQLWYRE